MKKRILSLVLCAAMLLSMCLFLGAGVTNSLTVCDSSGEAVKRVDLPVNQKISLTAQAQSAAENDAYQWQIRAAKDVWANILGSDTQTLELSYPMVASALSEKNTVQIRCRLTSAETGEATFSDAVTVEVTAATAVDTPASADAAAAPVLRSPAKVAAAANDAPEYRTYTIIIKYQFTDGRQAANQWSATVANGTTYTQDVTSPTVVGYTPDPPVVHVDSSKTTEYIVNYRPAKVNFTVKHYQQNVNDDNYTLFETETKQGFTESPVGDVLAKNTKTEPNYSGFYSLLYDTSTKIAADGSTEVEIYYDRYYYLMNFNLDGGYGVEPIYARYDAPINVGNPTKPGYSFDKWEPTLPATMPAENTTHKATWHVGETSYTVVYWYENANDNGYSYVADQKITNVAPGTPVSSDDYKGQNFTSENKDTEHFTYNANMADTVTVAGDGSTILNVYFTRNTYTLTFRKLTCTKTSSWHSHSDSCYAKPGQTITAKYQKDIHENFPIKDGNKTIWWDVPSGCESFKPDTMLGSIDTMPGESITFKSAGTQSGATLYYYIEVLSGETGTYTHDGKQFKLYKQITLEKECQLTYSEEFHNITGFKQWWSDPKFDKMEQGGVAYAGYHDGGLFGSSYYYINDNNYLCYTRNSYNLKFYNYNAPVDGRDAIVQYEAPLSGYNFTPDYPAKLEEGAYEFAGWCTTAGCYAGSEVNWETATMPASDVTLYAKWVPVTHTVKTWLTDAEKTPVNVGGTGSNEQTVTHRELATKPDTPSNGNYTFVGWFYKDTDGTEHAFDFSMPVTKDLNLYAKWSSNKLMEYTIHYQLKDGTSIADDTKGSALAGSTKTFEAKTGDQLNEGYQSGYFPETSSHSITMDIEGTSVNGLNDFTFYYVQKEKVKYTVRYLEKGTNTVLHQEKMGETSDAVITEKFEQIQGYAPDAYQKRLVLSANDKENVLVFWYTKDTVHAPVQIVHEIQNIEGDKYTEYQSSTNLNGVIGDDYKGTPLTIPGFKYNESASTASGKLTEAGLVLTLKYDRIEYPYEFRFLEQGTDTELRDPVIGKARYQAQVPQTAPRIDGYTLVSEENQAINIAIEDSADVAKKNVKTFYYQEQTVDIKYQVVGPDGSGTLDNYQETQLKVLNGTVNGSTPTPNAGYKFVGWFENEACTQQVNNGWVDDNNKLTPQKSVPYDGQKGYGAATYYAKFERDVFDLKITKAGENIDPNQTFVFRVKGEDVDMQVVITGPNKQVIKNLPVGNYTITEDTSWSWKYTPVGSATQELKADGIKDGAATVTFVNENKGTNWLTSFAEVINSWKTTLTQTTVWPKN